MYIIASHLLHVCTHLCFQVLLSVTLKWSSLWSSHCSLGRGRPLGGGPRRPCRCLEAAEARVMEVTSSSADTNMLDTCHGASLCSFYSEIFSRGQKTLDFKI